MKKWITICLVLLAFVAVAIALSRWLLPLLGLAGAGNEMVRPIEGLLPWLLWIFIAALVLLLVNLRWDRILRRQQPLRLVDEAEEWGDDFRIGSDLPTPQTIIPKSNVRLFAEQLEPLERQESIPIAAASRPAPHVVPSVSELVPKRITVAFGKEPEAQVVEVPQPAARKSAKEDDAITPSDIAKAATLAQAASLAAARHQLPPPPEAFTDRRAELAELREARLTHTRLGLHGPGGTGKTALAVALARDLAPHYPAGQFYLDLKGTTARPLTTSEAQAQLLRALQPNAALPGNAAELPGNAAALQDAYQYAFADKRALLLLDNVADLPQLAALLPPDNCLLIATARKPLALPGLFALPLDVLPETAAAELLRRLTPRFGAHATTVAHHCGDLPLALRLAASALAQHPELAVETFAAKLARLHNAEPLTAALTLSYELLAPGLQKLWRTLAIFPDTFDVTGAAAVWTLHPERALKALHRLMECELVEGQLATGRYRLHDLLRPFANAQLGEAERQAAQQSHAEYYQSVLHEADALYEQGGEALPRGLNLAARDWHNLETGQAWAATHAATHQAAAELCSSYPDAGRYVLELRQPPRERLRWCEAALAASARLKLRKAEGRHLLALGQAHLRLNAAEKARVCLTQALELAREYEDQSATARALSGLGTLAYEAGEFAQARDQQTAALEAARLANDHRAATAALGGLGLAYTALGDQDTARERFDLQLAIAREIGDLAAEGQAHFQQALAHEQTGDRAQARAQAQQALALLEPIQSGLREVVQQQLNAWR